MSSPSDPVSRPVSATSHSNRGTTQKRKNDDDSSSRAQQLRQFLLMRDGTNHKDMNFVGSAAGIIYFIRAVHNTMVLGGRADQHIAHPTPESDHAPGEEDECPTSTMGSDWKYLWSSSEASKNTLLPSFDNLLAWSYSYFKHWHPAYPFLHAPSVLEHFGQISRDGFTTRTPADLNLRIILRSIMSISVADARQSGKLATPVPAVLLFDSYNDAIRDASHVLSQPCSIQSLQAVVSVILFLVSMLRYNAASRLEGLAVRMAYQLGMHKCPYRFSTTPSEDSLLSVRIFWSLYCIDRFISPSLGLPPAISDSDVDVCLPGSERHLKRGAVLQPAHDDRLDLLCFLAKHAQIRGIIMSLRDRSLSRTQADVELSQKLDTDLIQWQNDLDDYLDTHDDTDTGLTTLHRCVLTILRCESQMALYRPLLATAKVEPAYRSGLQNCISAARRAINTLHEALALHKQRQRGPDRLHGTSAGLLWPSFTWATWLSSFVMLYSGTEAEVSREISDLQVARATEILRHISLRGTVWPDACMLATKELQHLLTNENGPRSEKIPRIVGSKPLGTSRHGQSNISEMSHHRQHSTLRDSVSAAVESDSTEHERCPAGTSGGRNPSMDGYSASNLSGPAGSSTAIRSGATAIDGQSDNLGRVSFEHAQISNPFQATNTGLSLEHGFSYQGSTSLPPMLNDETNDEIFFGWQAHQFATILGQEQSDFNAHF